MINSILLLIGIILCVISCILNILECKILDIMFAFAGGCCLVTTIIRENPTALDVYRGNTTLEITYKDSIPIDSVVVFKDSYEK